MKLYMNVRDYFWSAKYRLWKLKKHLMEDDGIGVVEMILILVVLIALVITFREKLESLVNTIFSNISTKAAKVYK